MESYDLWNGTAPLYIEGEESPKIHYYPSEEKKTTATVVILAGGGYSHRAKHESVGYALYLNAHGYDAFVVDYRVSPYRFPAELLDARRGIRFVRYNAEKFGIDKNRVAIMGSSAGGHLAAMTSTYRDKIEGEGVDEIDNEDYIPSLQILCYPVIEVEGHYGSFRNLLGEERVAELAASVTPSLIADEKTPPAFMWHCTADAVVNVDNTYNYAKKLRSLNIPVELHTYPYGRHGLGLSDFQEGCEYYRVWADSLLLFFGIMGFDK